MNRNEILDKLREILKNDCQNKLEVNETTLLMKDLHLDSIQLLTLVTSIENQFQIFLEDDPENPPQTIGAVIDLILKSIE